VVKNPKVTPNDNDVEDYNIGTKQEPNMIKLFKYLIPENRGKYMDLMRTFSDVFAQSYEDLNEYDTSIIQHTIPIKKDENPFRHKLRRINQMLLPLIEK